MPGQTLDALNETPKPVDWRATIHKLGPGFAARAAESDAHDTFVAVNYGELKVHRVFSAGEPVELGGGGASHGEWCALVRELGRACGPWHAR